MLLGHKLWLRHRLPVLLLLPLLLLLLLPLQACLTGLSWRGGS
jgi:hypothetical protein